MPESPLVIINVNIMSNTQNQQTEKLTHILSVRCTEDDFIRRQQLSQYGKKKADKAYIHAIRKEHVLENTDLDNPPPLNSYNEA